MRFIKHHTAMSTRPLIPPFTRETAIEKGRLAEPTNGMMIRGTGIALMATKIGNSMTMA